MKTTPMCRRDIVVMTVSFLLLILPIIGACTFASSPTTPPGGAIVNSDSIVTAKIQAIRRQASCYPWGLDVHIEYSVDVDNLPNPTRDSVGKVVMVKTDQDMTSYKVGEVVTARMKYVDDVPKPGITLYMYDIVLEIHP